MEATPLPAPREGAAAGRDLELGADAGAAAAERSDGGVGGFTGALGAGLGVLGRGIAYLPLRAMDVLGWTSTAAHRRRGEEVEEVDLEITVWERPIGYVDPSRACQRRCCASCGQRLTPQHSPSSAQRDVPSASAALHGLAIGPMMVPLQAAQYVRPSAYSRCDAAAEGAFDLRRRA